MSHAALTSLLGKEFDGFLLAPVGEERNGMTLSVLSALARLGVDPWEETAALAAMPRDRARQRLAALIATTTKALASALNSDLVAARLIELLPTASGSRTAAPVAKTSSSSVIVLILIGLLLTAMTLVSVRSDVSPSRWLGLGHSAAATNSTPAP